MINDSLVDRYNLLEKQLNALHRGYNKYGRYIEVKGVEQLHSEVNVEELHPFNTKGETVNCICGQKHIQKCMQAYANI